MKTLCILFVVVLIVVMNTVKTRSFENRIKTLESKTANMGMVE